MLATIRLGTDLVRRGLVVIETPIARWLAGPPPPHPGALAEARRRLEIALPFFPVPLAQFRPLQKLCEEPQSLLVNQVRLEDPWFGVDLKALPSDDRTLQLLVRQAKWLPYSSRSLAIVLQMGWDRLEPGGYLDSRYLLIGLGASIPSLSLAHQVLHRWPAYAREIHAPLDRFGWEDSPESRARECDAWFTQLILQRVPLVHVRLPFHRFTTGHLLLAIMEVPHSHAAQILWRAGLTPEVVEATCGALLPFLSIHPTEQWEQFEREDDDPVPAPPLLPPRELVYRESWGEIRRWR